MAPKLMKSKLITFHGYLCNDKAKMLGAPDLGWAKVSIGLSQYPIW